MQNYQNKKQLYRKLMDELVEEGLRTPMSIDKIIERMAKIYQKAFPLKRHLTK